MKKNLTAVFVPSLLFVIIICPFLVLADEGIGGGDGGDGSGRRGIELENPLGVSTITEAINKIIAALRDYIAPPIVAIMVLYGAFQMLFAGGEPEKFATGRKTILYAAIGYAIILIASGISLIIKDILKV